MRMENFNDDSWEVEVLISIFSVHLPLSLMSTWTFHNQEQIISKVLN